MLIYKSESYEIVGCCMRVHRELGHGFLEAVYQEALAMEFADSRVPFVREKPIEIEYHGRVLEKKFIADFVCHGQILVEIKALSALEGNHTAQVINYLKATGLKLGLLVNFGTASLEYKRIVW